MTLTAERRHTLDVLREYGALLCERCEVDTPNPSVPFGEVYTELCPDCITENVTPWPMWWFWSPEGGYEAWTVYDVDHRGPGPFPWEEWIEEARYF